MSTPNKRTFVIRAGVTRRYGDHEIYYEISEQIEASNGQERRDAFQNLQAMLDDQVKVYEAVSLPHVRLPQGSAAASTGGTVSDTFPLESIIVENKQGKRFVSACGGRWAKFGVPIYKGCQTDIDIANLDYGVHDFSHLQAVCTIELEGDKAKRVRSIK